MTIDQLRALCRKLRLSLTFEVTHGVWAVQKEGERHPIRYRTRDILRMTEDDLRRDFT